MFVHTFQRTYLYSFILATCPFLVFRPNMTGHQSHFHCFCWKCIEWSMCIVFTKCSLTSVVSKMIDVHFEKTSRESNSTTIERNAFPSFQESSFAIIHSDGRLSYSAGPSSQRVSNTYHLPGRLDLGKKTTKNSFRS